MPEMDGSLSPAFFGFFMRKNGKLSLDIDIIFWYHERCTIVKDYALMGLVCPKSGLVKHIILR